MSEVVKSETLRDKIHIADEVIANIAALAVGKTPSIVPSNTGFLGIKNPGKGIKVETNDNGVSLEIYVNMEYGCRISAVGKQLQNAVREDLEEMTGLKVLQVNVHVLGINIRETQKDVKALKDAKENKDFKNALEVKEFIEVDKAIIDEKAITDEKDS